MNFEFFPKSRNGLISYANEFKSIWLNIGYSEKEGRQKMMEIDTVILEALKKQLVEEREDAEAINNHVDELRQVMLELAYDLEIPIPQIPENATPIELEKFLTNKCKAFDVAKIEKLNAIEELRKIEHELCSQLQMDVIIFDRKRNLPSNADFKKIEKQIDKLKKIVYERKQEMTNYIQEITRIGNEYQLNDFAMELISNGLENLSEEHIRLVKGEYDELKEYVQKQQKKGQFLLREINLLNVKLDKQPSDFGEIFSEAVIEIMEDVLKKLQQERKDNFSKEFRKKEIILKDLEEKNMITHVARYSERNLNEDVLNEMDLEIVQLTDRYNVSVDIIKSIENWGAMWERFCLLELKSMDANRFKNRGGQMLQDEKEKKQLIRALPKLQRNIEVAILGFEEEQHCQFKVHGLLFKEFIANKKSELQIGESFKSQKNETKNTTNITANSTISRKRGYDQVTNFSIKPNDEIPKKHKMDNKSQGSAGRTPLKIAQPTSNMTKKLNPVNTTHIVYQTRLNSKSNYVSPYAHRPNNKINNETICRLPATSTPTKFHPFSTSNTGKAVSKSDKMHKPNFEMLL